MAIEFIRGSSRKPVAANRLIEILTQKEDWDGRLFIGYPISRTTSGLHHVDALWVSREKGVVAFDLREDSSLDEIELRHEDLANKIEIKLRSESELVRKRKLLVPIHTISFAPGANVNPSDIESDYPACGSNTLLTKLQPIHWSDSNESTYRKALSVLDKVSKIRSSRIPRRLTMEDSRGAKLKSVEDSIATLDQLQSKAVMETVEGVQRIRGLAGSGKTIVLALKAAYLHAQNPEWRIAVTFNTRSLKSFYRRLIRDFHFDQTDEEPNWDNLRVVNSWGAPGSKERDGIYHEYCQANSVEYFDFRTAREKFGYGAEFKRVCIAALKRTEDPVQRYDAILIDEAQDLPPEFLKLCYASLKNPKRLVYAYDELQNLAEETLPSPELIFGADSSGVPIVQFYDEEATAPKQDMVLPTCYRNPRPILVAAHSLGFGIYREIPSNSSTGLVQMFDHPQLWKSVGYQEKEGGLIENEEVTLTRSENASPRFLEKHSDIDDLVKFVVFKSIEEQSQWVAKSIQYNLEHDDLGYGDIMVINPDPVTTRNKVGQIRALLLEMNIQSHLAGVDTDPDIFYVPETDSITFTGIHRAKGNEAAMVYVINADDCQSASHNLASIRNRLFTAITRSKAWVRVSGVGLRMEELQREYTSLKAAHYELRFRYPTLEERQYLRTIHRDTTLAEKRRIHGQNQNLMTLINDIEQGVLQLEDIDEDLLRRLDELRES